MESVANGSSISKLLAARARVRGDTTVLFRIGINNMNTNLLPPSFCLPYSRDNVHVPISIHVSPVIFTIPLASAAKSRLIDGNLLSGVKVYAPPTLRFFRKQLHTTVVLRTHATSRDSVISHARLALCRASIQEMYVYTSVWAVLTIFFPPPHPFNHA